MSLLMYFLVQLTLRWHVFSHQIVKLKTTNITSSKKAPLALLKVKLVPNTTSLTVGPCIAKLHMLVYTCCCRFVFMPDQRRVSYSRKNVVADRTQLTGGRMRTFNPLAGTTSTPVRASTEACPVPHTWPWMELRYTDSGWAMILIQG